MGEALLSCLVDRGTYQPQAVLVSDPQLERRAFLAQTYGVQVTADNRAAAEAAVLLLAIKPQIFDAVTAPLAAQIGTRSLLVISILAGTPLEQAGSCLSQPAGGTSNAEYARYGWGRHHGDRAWYARPTASFGASETDL